MLGICKYNKMINCETQNRCAKCSWNPTYFDEVKEKNRKEMAEKQRIAMEKQNPKKPLISLGDIEDATPICNCPECQQNLYVEQKYCDNCGQKLNWRDVPER